MRGKWLIVLMLTVLAASEAWADVVVIMRREAEASGNYIRICDIARVEGPDEQAREVGLTVLGPTPARGELLEITRWDIEARLFEMGIASRIVFSGNEQVLVFGNGASRRNYGQVEDQFAYQPLAPVRTAGDANMAVSTARDHSAEVAGRNVRRSGEPESGRPFKPEPRVFEPAKGPSAPAMETMSDDAKKRVSLAISHYLAGRYKRPDIEVESLLLNVSEDVPYTAHDVQVVDAVNGRVPGKATLLLKVKDEADSAPREVMASVEATVYAQAPVAARQLYKGDALEKRDVMITRVKMESGKAYLPPNVKAVDGRELKRNLKAGEPVLASDAVPGEAVRRGDLVVVDTAGRGWQIQTVAKAVGSGMVGDMITVEDTSTKTKYPARITGRGVVTAITRTGLNKDKRLP